MVNWLIGEVLMIGAFSLTSWRSFKAVKSQSADYDLLKLWSILGVVRLLESYFEFLISWFPFYFVAKSVFLGLLLVPKTRLIPFVFETSIVPSMSELHRVLNGFVLPNIIEFIILLPWKVLVAIFPILDSSPGTPCDSDAEGDFDEYLSPRTMSRQVASARKERIVMSEPIYEFELDDIQVVSETDIDSMIKQDSADFSDVKKISERKDARRQGHVRITEVDNSDCESHRSSLNSSSKKKSLSNLLRSVVTGDADIRVRDHLFDLETSAPPQPKRKSISRKNSRSATATANSGRRSSLKYFDSTKALIVQSEKVETKPLNLVAPKASVSSRVTAVPEKRHEME